MKHKTETESEITFNLFAEWPDNFINFAMCCTAFVASWRHLAVSVCSLLLPAYSTPWIGKIAKKILMLITPLRSVAQHCFVIIAACSESASRSFDVQDASYRNNSRSARRHAINDAVTEVMRSKPVFLVDDNEVVYVVSC
jgi:hypothetical protein